MKREVFMMANEEKMEQKQEGRKHNLKVFVIMIPLLIVSFLGLIVFSGKIYSYHTMFTKANEFYIKIYGIDYNPTEQEKTQSGYIYH